MNRKHVVCTMVISVPDYKVAEVLDILDSSSSSFINSTRVIERILFGGENLASGNPILIEVLEAELGDNCPDGPVALSN